MFSPWEEHQQVLPKMVKQPFIELGSYAAVYGSWPRCGKKAKLEPKYSTTILPGDIKTVGDVICSTASQDLMHNKTSQIARNGDSPWENARSNSVWGVIGFSGAFRNIETLLGREDEFTGHRGEVWGNLDSCQKLHEPQRYKKTYTQRGDGARKPRYRGLACSFGKNTPAATKRLARPRLSEETNSFPEAVRA